MDVGDVIWRQKNKLHKMAEDDGYLKNRTNLKM
jgi:hypothetical protein